MAVMQQSDIARLLGVGRNRVHMWAHRRGTTKFPSMVAQTLHSRRPLYDMDDVVDWYSRWDPNKGRGQHWDTKRKSKTTVRRKHG